MAVPLLGLLATGLGLMPLRLLIAAMSDSESGRVL